MDRAGSLERLLLDTDKDKRESSVNLFSFLNHYKLFQQLYTDVVVPSIYDGRENKD